MKLYISLLAFIYATILTTNTFACELKMGFRTTERLPLIGKDPINDGLYYDIYGEAAQKIGCHLTVIRSPKKRLLKMLEEGEIDFYPGFTFNLERANYVHFIESGLPGGQIGISRYDIGQITNLHQLSGLTLIQSLGAPDFAAGVEDITYYTKAELSILEAINLIRKRRADFYIYPRGTLMYYLRLNETGDIQVHLDCCGGVEPLYLGFSIRSKYIEQQSNPNFDPDRSLSAGNWPTSPAQNSIAYRFQQQLKAMKESGVTMILYKQYY